VRQALSFGFLVFGGPAPSEALAILREIGRPCKRIYRATSALGDTGFKPALFVSLPKTRRDRAHAEPFYKRPRSGRQSADEQQTIGLLSHRKITGVASARCCSSSSVLRSQTFRWRLCVARVNFIHTTAHAALFHRTPYARPAGDGAFFG